VPALDSEVTCPKCGEVQLNHDFLCARCGASLETNEEHKERLAVLEQSRREAEHNDVSIQRFPGFAPMARHSRSGHASVFQPDVEPAARRYLIVIVVLAIGIVFLLSR